MEVTLATLSLAWFGVGLGAGCGLTLGGLYLLSKFVEQTSPASLEDWPQ